MVHYFREKIPIIEIWRGPKYALETYCKEPQPATTCSKLTIETLEQDVKYVQS